MRFLEQLADAALRRANGDAPAGTVRAVLPSRFATRAGGPAVSGVGPMVEGDQWGTRAQVPQRPAPERYGGHAGVAPGDRSARPGSSDARNGADASSLSPSGERFQPDRYAAGNEAANSPAVEHRATAMETASPSGWPPSMLTDAARSRVIATPDAQPGTSGGQTSNDRPSTLEEGRISASGAIHAGVTARPATAETRLAPLGDAVLMARIGASRPEGPVIHVTIDRIDVRSPPAAAHGPSESRRRPAPSVTLSEYLRGRGRSGGQE